MTPIARHCDTLVLPGIDGTNPLGFLAAVGLLRLLDAANRDAGEGDPTVSPPLLRWVEARGSWRPQIRGEGVTDTKALVAIVLPRLKSIFTKPPFVAVDGSTQLSDTLKVLPQDFRAMAEVAVRRSRAGDRDWTDWMAALASETSTRRNAQECMKCSFDFTAGQQRFLPMARAIIEQCDDSRLERCLVKDWSYLDTGESLRWDPIDESRRYAHSAVDPTNASKNPIQTDFAANALGFAALPLFPIVGRASLGFTPRRDAFRWPIWEGWVSTRSIPSIVLLSALHAATADTGLLRARGILAVFESSVVLPVGYYRNFTPAKRVA